MGGSRVWRTYSAPPPGLVQLLQYRCTAAIHHRAFSRIALFLEEQLLAGRSAGLVDNVGGRPALGVGLGGLLGRLGHKLLGLPPGRTLGRRPLTPSGVGVGGWTGKCLALEWEVTRDQGTGQLGVGQGVWQKLKLLRVRRRWWETALPSLFSLDYIGIWRGGQCSTCRSEAPRSSDPRLRRKLWFLGLRPLPWRSHWPVYHLQTSQGK